MNMEFRRRLPAPEEVMNMYPLTEEMKKKKAENDAEIRRVFTGEDDRFVLVIGPCSADREDAVLDYISRLREVQEKVRDKILIIPRIYTNKPRTTGVGYKGMLHQSDPHTSPDMLRGLMAIRRLHVKSLAETGFSAADEMLYPENHRYLADVLSYVGRAVGRKSAAQAHRKRTRSARGHEKPDERRPVGHGQRDKGGTDRTRVQLRRLGGRKPRQPARSRRYARLGQSAGQILPQLSL